MSDLSAYDKLSAAIRNNTPIFFGKFYQDKSVSDVWEKMPIEWIIISKTAVPYLSDSHTYTLQLISKKVLLFSQWLNRYSFEDNWISSRVREDLQKLAQEIFNEDEMLLIQPVPANKDCFYDEVAHKIYDGSYDSIVNSDCAKEVKHSLLEKDMLYLMSYDFEQFHKFRELEENKINAKDLHESSATNYALENARWLYCCKGPGGVGYWTKTVAVNEKYVSNEDKGKTKVGVIHGLGSGGGTKRADHIAGIRPCVTIKITVRD